LISTICAIAPITNAAEASLHMLMELAAVQHPSILQARDRLDAAGFDVEGAKWGRFPTISSETRAPSNNTQSLTKVEQPLWTGGRISAQIELSEANRSPWVRKVGVTGDILLHWCVCRTVSADDFYRV